MAGRKYRQYRKNPHKKVMKTLFVCGEGETENKYFNHLSKLFCDKVHIKCVEASHSSPNHLLKEMAAFTERNDLRAPDEAWLVVDRDSWTDSQFSKLKKWSEDNGSQNVAVTNPKFEFWLLLHFDDGNKIANAKQCDNRLVKKMKIKNISTIKNPNESILQKFNETNIKKAIERAKKRLINSENSKWPTEIGTTTVHLLASRIWNT